MRVLYSDSELNDREFCEVCGKAVGQDLLAVIQKTVGKFIIRARICFDHVDGTTTPWTLDKGAQNVEDTIKSISQTLESYQSLSEKAKNDAG